MQLETKLHVADFIFFPTSQLLLHFSDWWWKAIFLLANKANSQQHCLFLLSHFPARISQAENYERQFCACCSQVCVFSIVSKSNRSWHTPSIWAAGHKALIHSHLRICTCLIHTVFKTANYVRPPVWEEYKRNTEPNSAFIIATCSIYNWIHNFICSEWGPLLGQIIRLIANNKISISTIMEWGRRALRKHSFPGPEQNRPLTVVGPA